MGEVPEGLQMFEVCVRACACVCRVVCIRGKFDCECVWCLRLRMARVLMFFCGAHSTANFGF